MTTKISNGVNFELLYKKIKRVLPRNLAQKLPKTVHIVLIDTETSRRINARFRKKRTPTNVLSFRYDPAYGEILLCAPIIRKDAHTQGNSYAFQMTWMIVHGMIHLSGLHHERSAAFEQRVMRLEQKILDTLVKKTAKSK
ncbi:MAG: rRNA maturation RNase YbeY [Candidatus Sungbacteria bacterium]|nr:rRNA maturation RNase YbeY [bacterium]MDZ4260124.1 rRNA maturation RNase YbeY [Candidatus Sungbacteria bacterium]